MLLIRLLELFAFAFLFYVVYSQMILPAFNNSKMFPWFQNQRKLEHKVYDLEQEIFEKELEKVIEAKQNKLKQ